MGTTPRHVSARELLVVARKTAAKALSAGATTQFQRLKLSTDLLADTPKKKLLADFAKQIASLDINQRHYWIGTFYTLLLPPAVRRAQAAYFTPPHLSEALLGLVRGQGFDPLRQSAIDPAAGGAAFLSTLAGQMHALGMKPRQIIGRLRGFEIDRGLASLSERLIGDRIGTSIADGSIVSVKEALRAKLTAKYDLVIANPPYGRVSPADVREDVWRHVCHPGHLNKYALFTELCFRLAKPRGLIALVLPSSFIAGTLYGRLRTFIRQHGEVLSLGSVTTRNDVFVDVAQDVSILLVRAGVAHRPERVVSFGHVGAFGPFKLSAAHVLQKSPDRPWITQSKQLRNKIGGSSFADYGAVLRVGYFVWNRELERMRTRARGKLDLPLIWAKNVRSGKFCRPTAKRGSGIDYVNFEEPSSAIVRTDAIIMQRTTNNAQARRLVATRLSPSVIKRWGGFVAENHTIVITAGSVSTLNALCVLLNSAALDARYRQLSGTASVSVNLLRELDLPAPQALEKAIAQFGPNDAAVEHAYETSASFQSKALA